MLEDLLLLGGVEGEFSDMRFGQEVFGAQGDGGGSGRRKVFVVCPSCNGIYSRYQGRYKIHIRACERKATQSAPPPRNVYSLPRHLSRLRSSPQPRQRVSDSHCHLLLPLTPRGPDAQDINMEDARSPEVDDNTPSPTPPDGVDPIPELPSIGVERSFAPKPGETLVMYHPHSQRPMRVAPTADPHGPTERTHRHDIRKSEDSYAPFPSRADFEQAEIFINDGCSDEHIDKQLKFQRENGPHLKVKTAREMHRLLALGVGEDVDDSRVGSIHPASYIPHTNKCSLSFGMGRVDP